MKCLSTASIKGYNGLTVRIDPDFKPLLDEMDLQVRKCGVTMWITHAFRKDGQDLDGTGTVRIQNDCFSNNDS